MKQDFGIFITPEVRFGDLSQVYWEAADSIFDSIIKNHHRASKKPGNIESIFLSLGNSAEMLPALFLYRHCIELMIKESLRLAELLGHGCPKKIHNLKALFENLLSACNEHCDPKVYIELQSSYPVIEQLHIADEKGTKYRYEDQNHKSYCVLTLKTNYAQVKNAIEKVKSNFSAIVDYQAD